MLDGGVAFVGVVVEERLGEVKPLQARIVAVADSFDAMTSGRAYQPAVSEDAALEEMERCRGTPAGTHFDPACVDAFRTALTRARESNEFLMMRTAVTTTTKLPPRK